RRTGLRAHGRWHRGCSAESYRRPCSHRNSRREGPGAGEAAHLGAHSSGVAESPRAGGPASLTAGPALRPSRRRSLHGRLYHPPVVTNVSTEDRLEPSAAETARRRRAEIGPQGLRDRVARGTLVNSVYLLAMNGLSIVQGL